MVEDLIGIPSLRALGKNEAVYIINKLMDPTKWPGPPPAKTAAEIEGVSSNLPSYSQIYAIRMTVKELGWEKEHFYNWLKKWVKRESIRDLDRETAHKAYIGLIKLKTRRML